MFHECKFIPELTLDGKYFIFPCERKLSKNFILVSVNHEFVVHETMSPTLSCTHEKDIRGHRLVPSLVTDCQYSASSFTL